MLALEGLSIGVFAATDVFLFYVFFEATLIPVYFLVGGYGGPTASVAAVKFLLFSLFGGLVMLASVIGLYVESAKTDGRSDVPPLRAGRHGLRHRTPAAGCSSASSSPSRSRRRCSRCTPGCRTPPQSATPGTSVLLVSVLDKIGTFGMIRFCLELFPEASRWATPVVRGAGRDLASCTARCMAIGQTNIPRLIAYTSV